MLPTVSHSVAFLAKVVSPAAECSCPQALQMATPLDRLLSHITASCVVGEPVSAIPNGAAAEPACRATASGFWQLPRADALAAPPRLCASRRHQAANSAAHQVSALGKARRQKWAMAALPSSGCSQMWLCFASACTSVSASLRGGDPEADSAQATIHANSFDHCRTLPPLRGSAPGSPDRPLAAVPSAARRSGASAPAPPACLRCPAAL